MKTYLEDEQPFSEYLPYLILRLVFLSPFWDQESDAQRGDPAGWTSSHPTICAAAIPNPDPDVNPHGRIQKNGEIHR